MPHIIVEHSIESIDNKSSYYLIFSEIRNVFIELKDMASFDISQCKFRSIFFNDFLIGDSSLLQNKDSKHLFLHITVKIMEGRTLNARNLLADKIMEKIEGFFIANKITRHIELTVDIVEMNRDNYRKKLLVM
jgi:5-carboxymethyl-2-hydroxymuconate isomerase